MSKKISRRPLPDVLPALGDLPAILQRIYQARGISSTLELDHNLTRLLPYHSLLDIDQAVACIAEVMQRQQPILIVGDFDADGATSVAVAVRVLRSFGAQSVCYLVPNRFEFGYGLTPELVAVAKDYNPALIITVDNGIANHAGVAAAKALGIKVIITDHHLPAETLPPADAIVNPNRVGDPFPSKCIAGVGVIFYVMVALRQYLTQQQWFAERHISIPNLAHVLDLVALGTVADVVALDQNNRILVAQGLRRIRAGLAVPGIHALLTLAKRNLARLSAADLGFAVAPRLNAAGRLDDMSIGIECLLTDDAARALSLAQQLDQMNHERRVIEYTMQEQAFKRLQELAPEQKSLPYGICLFAEEWHQGVIGILASRVKDKFERPVIAFAPATDIEIKGSARSIAGIHIRDILARIATLHPEVLQKFGGHAMAAGLTLRRAMLPKFSEIFNELIAEEFNRQDLAQGIWSDGELTDAELSLEVAELLREAGPWGQAFPEPLFDGVFEVLEQRLVGEKHLKMYLGKDQKVVEVIVFNVNLKEWPNYHCKYVNIVYKLDINEYRGKRSMQLIVEHMEVA